MGIRREFASDNNSGIHPAVLKAIERANTGHTVAYGDDPFTEAAKIRFYEHFGDDTDVYFVFTGTGANVLGLRAITESYESVICSHISHLNVDECGAPENFIGSKLVTVTTRDGKITPNDILPLLTVFDVEHHSQPGVISITQATELGTVYTPGQIAELAELAHTNNMLLHMDGARLSNAAAYLDMDLKAITRDVGVDVLSFGGTKNGMMIGEAVVFFNKDLSGKFKYIRKQGMQLGSKMRFISSQFETFLSNDLWKHNALHANAMAQTLAEGLRTITQCKITQTIEANAVFVIIPPPYIDRIRDEYFFYTWDPKGPVVRLMTSFDTQVDDIQNFIETAKRAFHQ
jgi:threonine aldolase